MVQCGGVTVEEGEMETTEFRGNWSCRSKSCGVGTCCAGNGCSVWPCMRCEPGGGCGKGQVWSRSACKCSKQQCKKRVPCIRGQYWSSKTCKCEVISRPKKGNLSE